MVSTSLSTSTSSTSATLVVVSAFGSRSGRSGGTMVNCWSRHSMRRLLQLDGVATSSCLQRCRPALLLMLMQQQVGEDWIERHRVGRGQLLLKVMRDLLLHAGVQVMMRERRRHTHRRITAATTTIPNTVICTW